MRHVSEGVLRRFVDEPLAITDSQRNHLASCRECEARYASIRTDARLVTAALDLPVFSPDTGAALDRVRRRMEGTTSASRNSRLRAILAPRLAGRKVMISGAAVAAMLAALTLTPAGSLAQSFVTIFQPTNVAAVPLTSLDLRSLAQLRHYGTIHVSAEGAGSRADSAQTAGDLAHMSVLQPSGVPAGVPETPHFTVSPGATATFTFSSARARAWANKSGAILPPMPRGIDGSTIAVQVGTSVVTTYGGCVTGCSEMPALIIGQMVAPKVTSSGASLKGLEGYVLNLPGVSPQLATELRTIGDPTSTLPIPIPASVAHVDAVTVQGVHGEAIGDNTGVGSLVVWEKDGVVYAVGGALPIGQVQTIADSLR